MREVEVMAFQIYGKEYQAYLRVIKIRNIHQTNDWTSPIMPVVHATLITTGLSSEK